MTLGESITIRERVQADLPFIVTDASYAVYASAGGAAVFSGTPSTSSPGTADQILAFQFTPTFADRYTVVFQVVSAGEVSLYRQEILVQTAPPESAHSMVRPTAEQCRRWTGLNSLIVDNVDEQECDDLIKDHINEVEVEVALSLGENLFDGTDWTPRQALAVRRSWAYRAAASFLMQPYLQKVTGTHAPLIFEDSDAIATAIEFFNGKAEAFEVLAQSGVSTDKDAPFAMPAASSSTYSPSSSTPAGFTRNRNLDELAHLPVQQSGIPESVESTVL